ncbi:hypothetical protein C8J57DRAFT_1241848 [Mycena rebaudengoi]|nr:hypothetical protein C8J57DRAFT_1241848 [Mycena rebaudengoi]
MAATSYANMNVIAILTNPRKLPSLNKTTFYDAYVYIGPTEDDMLLGCVRHFNSGDTPVDFEAGPHSCIIMVAKSHADIEFVGEPANQYAFVGDLKDFAAVDITSPRRAYMHVSSAVTKSDKGAGTFELEVKQYTAAYADLAKEKKDKAAPPSILPVTGFFQDSPRYKRGKPVPWVNRLVMFGGYLTGIAEDLDGDGVLKQRFVIDADNIAFLGTMPPPATTPANTPLTMASGSGSGPGGGGGSSKPRFSNFRKRARKDDEDAAPSSSPSPFTSK